MKTPEKLIGKKVKGFKFEDTKKVVFPTKMNKYIGIVGQITEYYEEYNSFRVLFFNNSFSYPADQIEAHLVEDEIPTLSDGVMMLVSDDNSKYSYKPRRVIGEKEGFFYCWSEAYPGEIIKWKYAKPLEPTKEEQLTAILGSSEKVSEIMELFKN